MPLLTTSLQIDDKNIRAFKAKYFSACGGKYNLGAQIPYLKNLADHYYNKYQETDDWRDCLKV